LISKYGLIRYILGRFKISTGSAAILPESLQCSYNNRIFFSARNTRGQRVGKGSASMTMVFLSH
jgi:hypothetical protein